jgi:hypothetical protein
MRLWARSFAISQLRPSPGVVKWPGKRDWTRHMEPLPSQIDTLSKTIFSKMLVQYMRIKLKRFKKSGNRR